jgi:hypothetical protein
MVSASRDDGPSPVPRMPAPVSEQACLALEAAAAAAGWLVLVSVRSPSLLVRLLATGTPLLLIEPNAAQAARLAAWLDGADPAKFRLCSDLPGSGLGSVLWHHYNDPRRDGPWPPEALLPAHPNLRLSHTSLRPTMALEFLLECWEQGPMTLGAEGLLLVEEASLPAVLAGAGSLLPLLGWVGWLLPEPLEGPEAMAGIEIQMQPPLAVPPALLLPGSVAGDGRLLRYQRQAPSSVAADQAGRLRGENLALRRRIAQLRQLVIAGEDRLRALETRAGGRR